MSNSRQQLADSLRSNFADKLSSVKYEFREITAVVSVENYIEVATELRDSSEFGFNQLVDLCGVDYLQFGQAEWQTDDASRAGYSRGWMPPLQPVDYSLVMNSNPLAHREVGLQFPAICCPTVKTFDCG